MKKPYYLYTRPRKDGKKVFYVKFRSPDGEYLSGKSTGETDQSAAGSFEDERFNLVHTYRGSRHRERRNQRKRQYFHTRLGRDLLAGYFSAVGSAEARVA